MHYIKKTFARSLRKEATVEEKKVWEVLRNRKLQNLKFRRQHVIEGFVVDFYCREIHLAIEIDGKVHDKQKDYDMHRQRLIEERGVNFIRITNEEINKDIEFILAKINRAKSSFLPAEIVQS
jgi:very-short-patch-repair endonuclease